jgi:hypothetical protein
MKWNGPALLAAALLGFAVGATWLFPSFLAYWPAKFDYSMTNLDKFALSPASQDPSHAVIKPVSGDNRSATLRMAHTLADALLATAIVVLWQRLYGSHETGWMSAPLRVMGFVSAVVHMAWAQVHLAQPQHTRTNPFWVGLAGFASVALLGAGCAITLEMGWLEEVQWREVRPYLFPLVLWQGSSCFAAAYSHLPFHNKNAMRYSWACMAVIGVQGSVLLLPMLHCYKPTAQVHFLIFGLVSTFAMIALTFYIHCIDRLPPLSLQGNERKSANFQE